MNVPPKPLDVAVPVDLAAETDFRLGETEVRPSLLEVWRRGVATSLEPRVMQVLTVLARRPGSVTSRDELVATCWSGRFIGEDAIHRTLAKVRHAAEVDAGGDFFIETVPRVGYRLVLRGVPSNDDVDGAVILARPRLRRAVWFGLAGAVLAVVIAAGAWWMQRPPPPAAVELAAIQALDASVPRAMPGVMLEDLRAALGEDNAVHVKTRGADFVLRSSLQRAGENLRYVVRLDDMRDGTMVWSGSRDWPAGARFTPRQVAVETSQILRCGLRGAADHPRRLTNHVLGLFLQQCEVRVVQLLNWERVLTLNRRIVAEAPDFSRGWSGVASAALRTAWRLADKVPDRAARRAEAGQAAARALRLDRRNAEALTVQAFLHEPAELVQTEALLRRAVAGRLSDCGCELLNYAGFFEGVGRLREANVWYRRAYEGQPLFQEEIILLADSYDATGQFELAAALRTKAAAIYGDSPWFRGARSLGEARVGRWDSYVDVVTRFSTPDRRPALLAAIAAARAKDPAALAAARPGMLALNARYPNDLRLVPLLIEVGARDAALAQLRSGIAGNKGSAGHAFFVDFLPLIRDPAVSRLVEASPEMAYWRKTGTRPDVCGERDPPAFCAKI